MSTILKEFDRVKDTARSMMGDQTKLWDHALTSLGSMQKTESGVDEDEDGNTVLRFMVSHPRIMI